MIDPYDVEEIAVQIDSDRNLLELLIENLDNVPINEDKYTLDHIAREFERVKPHLVALSYVILNANNDSYEKLMELVDYSIQNDCECNNKEDGK